MIEDRIEDRIGDTAKTWGRLGALALALGASVSLGPASVSHGAELGPSGAVAELAADAGAALRGAASERAAFTYTLAMANPQRHEFQVTLRFDDLPGEVAVVELPKWNPGAYHLTNAHRNVRAVRAQKLAPAKGEDPALAVAKLDENSWEIGHGGAAFELHYRVYCGRYTGIGGCYLDDAMGFVNGAHVFMYAVGHKHRAVELVVEDLPGGKQAEVVTGLPPAQAGKARAKARRFWANNFDVLIDSPIHAGVVETVEFELGGRPMRAVMSNEGAWKADEVRAELLAITEAAAAVFGPLETALPFTDYTFIFEVLPDASGGLEHLNSTAIGVDPWLFADERGKRRWWSVSAHEFFHLWNVKRIRPAVLGPFDYDREVHTTMLWFSEGFTSYYSVLINSRAGLLDEHAALDELERRIANVETRPGRALMSVEQSSWETWAKPDDAAKAYFSYYDKGAVIGMLFDLHLRGASKGVASTDTVFQALWQRFRATGLGLTPQQLEQAFLDQAKLGGEASVEQMRELYAAYVRGTVELDYDRFLAHAGYRLERRIHAPGPWIGAKVGSAGADALVREVDHEGPGDRGGLGDGDVIRAIDDHAVSGASFAKTLAGLELGRPHSFTVERLGRVVELSIEVVEGGEERFEIVELDDVSAEQLLLRRAWLGLRDEGED